MALQTMTEAARNGTLRDRLIQYLEYCQCPDGNDSQTPPGSNRRPRRLFPNLAGFCFWMECGFSAFHELQATYPDEADMILCAMEDQALNAYYLKVTILMAYLRNRLGYDPPKRRSGSRNRAKDRDRPCRIEVYSVAQYEALFGTADSPPVQDNGQSHEHVPDSLREPTPAPLREPTPAPPREPTTAPLREPTSAPPREPTPTHHLPPSRPPPRQISVP